MFLSTITLVITCLVSFGQAAPTSPLNYNVHLFYYPWYGAANGPTKQWNHWNGGGRKPPQDITSNYYPVLGAYDSCDALSEPFADSSCVGTPVICRGKNLY